MITKVHRLKIVSALIAAMVTTAGVASAEQIIALTSTNVLISFDSATPGTVNTIGAITGVTAGDTLVGIDRRPSPGPNNNRVYAVGINLGVGTGRIYTLDLNTAQATLVATLAADPADVTAPFPFTTVSGTTFGMDFNPVVDRLRLVSNTGQNLRINVDNGLVQLDVPLAYQAGDPNFGDAPVVSAVAYSNNFPGALSRVLRGVDLGQDTDVLAVHTNPNGGLLQTSLNLPFNSVLSAYDVSGLTGSPYFTTTPQGSSTSSLFLGTTLIGSIGGGVPIVGIAAPLGVAPVPTVTGVAPSSGPSAGGTVVTITGTEFSTNPNGTTVTFGAAAATDVSCASATSCVATSPAGVGTVSVRATVAAQTSADTPADDFTYLPPAVTQIAPTSGPSVGGTVVTISGTGFSTMPGVTTVTFGATPATGVSCASATACVATSPAGVGIVSVRAAVLGQMSADTPADDFTYIPAPVITQLDPLAGPVAGGTVVTITGTGFSTLAGATAVSFGALPATTVLCASTTSCEATSPVASGPGNVDVRVTVDGQSSANTVADNFTYFDLSYYLAEGATGPFFDNELLIVNPNDVETPVTLRFFKDDGTTVVDQRVLAAQTRTTIVVDQLPSLSASAVSTHVTSDLGLPLVVERTMRWDANGYGGHTGGSVEPSLEWYFAEGHQGFFDTYLLLSNPLGTTAHTTVSFQPETGAPIVRNYDVLPASRLTIAAGEIPQLAGQAFTIFVESDFPIVAERSMYFGSTPEQLWSGGHVSDGASLTVMNWFHAEGATGDFFDTYFLVSNFQDVPANVTFRFLLVNGESVLVQKTIPAHTRLTLNVEDEADPRLKNSAFSTIVTSNQPIVSERSMYWAGDATPWGEGHNSVGSTGPVGRWALAEGRVGGSANFATFILLLNPTGTAAEVKVTYLRESGAPLMKNYVVPAMSRFNIDVATDVPELENESFGATIEGTNFVPFVVERSMYWDAKGVFWAAGTNAPATALP